MERKIISFFPDTDANFSKIRRRANNYVSYCIHNFPNNAFGRFRAFIFQFLTFLSTIVIFEISSKLNFNFVEAHIRTPIHVNINY